MATKMNTMNSEACETIAQQSSPEGSVPDLEDYSRQGAKRLQSVGPGDEITREEYGSAYTANFDRMIGQLCRMGADRNEAADLVQDAWATGWQRRHQLQDRARVTGWIWVSVIRRFYSSEKRDHRLVQWPTDYEPATTSGINHDAMSVNCALQKLTSTQKRLLEAILEGLSAREIACQLNKTLDAVYTQATRARSALRHELASVREKRP